MDLEVDLWKDIQSGRYVKTLVEVFQKQCLYKSLSRSLILSIDSTWIYMQASVCLLQVSNICLSIHEK